MTANGKAPVTLQETTPFMTTQKEFDFWFTDLLDTREKARKGGDIETVSQIERALKTIPYYPLVEKYDGESTDLYTAIRVYYNGKWYILCIITAGDGVAEPFEALHYINKLAATMQHLKGGRLQITLAIDPLQIPESKRLLMGITKVPKL